MKIVWQPQAIEDLGSLKRYIAADNPAAANRVATTIVSLVSKQVGRFPETGRNGRIEGTRELVVPRMPYIVVYRIKADVIDVLAVHHAARRWPDSF